MVVSPFSSKLTPVGQVMQLLSAHTAGALLALPAAAYSGDLELDTLAIVAARPPACNACQTAWSARNDFCEPPSPSPAPGAAASSRSP